MTDKLNITTQDEDECHTSASATSEPVAFFVSHFVSDSQFWIQLASSTEELAAVQKKIADAVASNAIIGKDFNELNVVYNSKRSMWCRAELSSKEFCGLRECFFVDYGDSAVTDPNKIYECPTSVQHVSRLARECMIKAGEYLYGLYDPRNSKVLCRGTLGLLKNGVQEIASFSTEDVDGASHSFDSQLDVTEGDDDSLVCKVHDLESSWEETDVLDSSCDLNPILEEEEEGTVSVCHATDALDASCDLNPIREEEEAGTVSVTEIHDLDSSCCEETDNPNHEEEEEGTV